MHVAPTELRSLRRDGVALHFVVLDTMVWVVAEFPASGSRGTFAEEWCERAHWGITIAGDVELDLEGGSSQPVAPGTVFHVPPGTRHRFLAGTRARVAGLDSIESPADLEDDALRRAGWEIPRPSGHLGPGSVAIVQPRPSRSPAPGEIVAESRRMGELLLTRTRFGRRAGYASEPCDQPHWGFVTMGNLAIEWEDDVEVLSAGDVFHCPAGPPGHRIQAAEAAAMIDFTRVDAIRPGDRVASWRARAAEAALREPPDIDGPRLGLVALR